MDTSFAIKSITTRNERAQAQLKQAQEQMISWLTDGMLINSSEVEDLMRKQQQARVWSQLGRLATKAGEAGLEKELGEWLQDALSMLLSSGSRSTSGVRNEEYTLERDALSDAVRSVRGWLRVN